MKNSLMWCAVLIMLTLVVTHAAKANMPDFYSEPGLNPTRAYSQSTNFDLVDPFTGKLQLHHTDILIPGNGGLNLEVGRSYTSGDSLTPGNSWTMGFGYVYRRALDPICTPKGFYTDDRFNPVLVLADGSRHVLADSSDSNLYITNQFWRANCINTPSGGLTITSPEGTVYDMTFLAGDITYQKWYVTKITDRNGNWINISYEINGNGATITGVSTSDGRTLTYTYTTILGSYKRLSSITDGTRTWSYTYIDNTTPGFSELSVGTFLLNKVTLPDSTSWVYTYNGNLGTAAGSYQISSVTTPQLGKVTYTYSYINFISAIGRLPDEVITSRSITGVGTWTYAYVPSTGVGTLDTTTVTAPGSLQTIVYKHYGYNAVLTAGETWKIGLLVQKTIGTVQTESYSWTPLKISNQTDTRVFTWIPVLNNFYYSPLLSTKTITRDGATYSTTYSGFDSYGNPGSVTETGPNGGNRTTSIIYNIDSAKWVLHQAKNESFTGSTITRLFDANHNLTSSTVNGVTTSHTYAADGSIATTTFPRGLLHSYSSYKRGIPQVETQPEGISITRVVSNAGTITSEKNGRGFTTSYVYDGLNRPTSITYPTGNPVSISYTATSKTATRGGLVESTIYDGFGRPTSVTLGGIKTTYQYDPLGRTTFKSNPGSTSGTSSAYDALDRVKIITQADATTRSYAYGAATVAITDERAKTTTYAYRGYGDPNQTYLMNITAPDTTANVAITRNTLDQVTTVAQGGLTRSYGYNANAYLSQVTEPETGVTTYGRDAAGNMTSRLVGASGTTTYTYDLQNRLSATSYPGGTPASSQTYTQTHKLSTVTSGTTTRALSYNANDSLISETLSVDGNAFTATYGYNANDQLSSITYPRSGKVVSYSPDVLGRPQSVSGYASAVTYWPSGQVQQINYQNGTISSYGQNARLWPSTFGTQKSASFYINNTYAYDQVGNLLSIADTTTPEFNRSFGYDAIDRLTTINASSSWGSGSIAYDGKGNITSQTFGTSGITYTYSPQNKLTSVSGGLRNASYTYDSYGDILSDGTGKTYTYNGVPNLVGVNDSNTSTTINYAYDGLSKRTKVIKNGVTTYEYHDTTGKLLLEYTPGTPNKLMEYIYLGNMRIAQRLSTQ